MDKGIKGLNNIEPEKDAEISVLEFCSLPMVVEVLLDEEDVRAALDGRSG
jgi:hypothetical protein